VPGKRGGYTWRRNRETSEVPLDIEDELDRLYGVDLGDFVAERTRLMGLLRKEGRRAKAQQVQELRKPSLSVWAVNQLARERRKDIDLLLDAAHRLAVAQRALLTGGGDRQAFERASTTEREVLNRLSQAARSILAERASAATLERVTSTLRAAAASDAARVDLARGRITTDIDLAGFEAFAGGPASVPSAPKPKAQPRRGNDDHAVREQAEREAAAKRAAINRARAELKSARERDANLAKRLREAERAERAARATHQQAERTVERVRADHEAASNAVEAARAKLEEAQGS
jgi:hypothetical protein